MGSLASKLSSPLWATLLLVGACQSIAVYASGVADPTRPALVRHVGQNKSGPFAVFNQGSSTGFVIGRDVCFYKSDAQKVSCGTIVRTKVRAAAVQLTSSEQADITEGLFVWPEDLGPVTADLLGKGTGAVSSKDTDDLVQEEEEPEDDPPEPELPPVLSRRLQIHVAPAIALPFWMNDLRFNAGARSSGTGEIWEGGDTIRTSLVGIGTRYYIPKHGHRDSAFDVTYHFAPQRPVKDDFDLTDGTTAVESSVWSHQFRLRYLYGATWLHSESSDLLLYSGVGYNYLRAKFRSAKTGASTDELINGTVTAHQLEIPVVVTWQQYFGNWMLNAGADMGMPLPMMGLTARGSLSYDENTADADKSLNGALEAINVRRAWFTMALMLGVGRTF